MDGINISDEIKKATEMIIRAAVLKDIHLERSRQNKEHPDELSLISQYIVLSEEVGEVAQALQAHYKIPGTKTTDKQNLYQELIHVAAVAVRMAERVKEI